MTRPWREEIAEALRRHQAPIGLGNEMPGDEYDCCADVILAKVADLLRSDEVEMRTAKAIRDERRHRWDQVHKGECISDARAALAVLREMVGGA